MLFRAILFVSFIAACRGEPDLPPGHLPYFYAQFPELRPANFAASPVCWGYEPACQRQNRFSRPVCNGSFAGWARDRRAAEDLFYQQADFGYVAKMLAGSRPLCRPSTALPADKEQQSELTCAKELQYCRAKNILIDFRALVPRITKESLRYKMDVLSPGEVKVACQLDQQLLNQSLEFMSPLQSWAPELRLDIYRYRYLLPVLYYLWLY
jgi:protein O-GlcNAc transferase